MGPNLLRMLAVRRLMLIIAVCAGLAIAGCGGDDDSSSTEASGSAPAGSQSGKAGAKTKPEVEVPDEDPSGKLDIVELEEGKGRKAKSGDKVTVQYVGVGYESGEEFDASWDRGEPFTFTLGGGEVISGWDQGVVGMKAGGRRELIIPPALAYGPAGAPPAIGPNETLVFVIDLLAVK